MKLMKLWLFIFFLFLIQTQFLLCQGKFHPEKISESTNEYVNKIAEINQIGCSVYGKCKQWENFQDLRDEASDEELLELTNHPKGVVRCYAFWAILQNKSHNLFPIILNHLQDYELVPFCMGDIIVNEQVGDFYLRLIKDSPGLIRTRTVADSILLVQIDSVLVYSDSQLGYKYAALEKVAPSEQLYPRIRAMVEAKTCDAALIALAKYKNNEDIPLIIDYLKDTSARYPRYYLYKAIQIFPHESFLPYLENDINNFQKNCDSYNYYRFSKKDLILTISAFKNEKAAVLFNRIFNKFDNSSVKANYKQMFYDVLSENICSYYNQFFWRLWEEEKFINKEVFLDLLNEDSLKALKMAKANLIEFKKIYHACKELSFKEKDSLLFELLSSMVDVMMKSDYAFAVDVINGNIENEAYDVWNLFMKKVAMIKDTAFVKSLFKRFEDERSTKNYLVLTKILISYHDNAINQRIFKTIKNEKVFQNEKARDEIEDLLDENDIEEE